MREKLLDRGFQCFSVPSAANIIKNGGINLVNDDRNQDYILRFQYLLLKLQMNLEQCLASIAKLEDKQAVILCNRGLMDGKAF